MIFLDVVLLRPTDAEMSATETTPFPRRNWRTVRMLFCFRVFVLSSSSPCQPRRRGSSVEIDTLRGSPSAGPDTLTPASIPVNPSG
jgi:hypothetical protein